MISELKSLERRIEKLEGTVATRLAQEDSWTGDLDDLQKDIDASHDATQQLGRIVRKLHQTVSLIEHDLKPLVAAYNPTDTLPDKLTALTEAIGSLADVVKEAAPITVQVKHRPGDPSDDMGDAMDYLDLTDPDGTAPVIGGDVDIDRES